MTDAQLYLAIGLPSVVALIGILVNIGYFVAINGRLNHMENRLDGRMSHLETDLKEFFRVHSEHDRRIQRLEDKP